MKQPEIIGCWESTSSATVREYTPIVFGGLAIAAALMSGVPVTARLQASVRLAARAGEDTPMHRRRLTLEGTPS